uniref:Arm_2 domain-containing protein n=1 Tax=Strongyloides papillosus TaxID=174720 RepID=A0A0N5BJR3_STREA
MGHQQSSFVVEIASPKYGKFQSIPQKDPDDHSKSNWRITVNPSAELSSNEQIKSLISRLYNVQRLLSHNDMKLISAALNCFDTNQDLFVPLLTIISNATAYPANQILFREHDITSKITNLFVKKNMDWPKSCRVMLLQCIANMAVDVENENILKKAIPIIIRKTESTVDMESVIALQALTNLSVNISSQQIHMYIPVIPTCINKLWVKGEVNLNSLRLLINLSCCPDIVPYILAAKTVTGLFTILDTDKIEYLVRAITWLLCLSTAVETLQISYEQISHLNQDPFHNSSFTIYNTLYGAKGKAELLEKMSHLSNHKNVDVSSKAKRLYETLRLIPTYFSSSFSLKGLL